MPAASAVASSVAPTGAVATLPVVVNVAVTVPNIVTMITTAPDACQGVTFTASLQGTPTQVAWSINGSAFTAGTATPTYTWAQLQALGKELGTEVVCFQTNHEGAMVDEDTFKALIRAAVRLNLREAGPGTEVPDLPVKPPVH